MQSKQEFEFYDVNYLESDPKRLCFINALLECNGQLLSTTKATNYLPKRVYHVRIKLPVDTAVLFMHLSGLGLEKPVVVEG